MKVSIIIVSWNVRHLLSRCLESIEKNRPSFPVEVIIVDNGSDDRTPEMIRERFPSVKLIVNSDNRGFAAACNQGIAVAAGEYCFFLNPDTEVSPGAIETLAKTLDDTQNAAIVASKILNSDGAVQKSIERFPTLLSQLLRFFKLSRFSKEDLQFNYEGGVQDVEQPMGAALMIRKFVLRELGNFDERFFIWFEEVDLCKRASDRGFRILYQPAAVITHQRGTSFAQHDVLSRQVMFYTSCRQYLEKHFGARASLPTLPMRLFTGVAGLFLPPFRGRRVDIWSAHRHIVTRTVALLIVIGALSFFGHFSDTIRAAGFLAIVLAAFVTSMMRLEYGLAIAFTELIVGSKGYLFSFPISDHASLSVRMGIFGAVMLAWLISICQKRTQAFSFRRSHFFPATLLVAAFFLYSLVTGFAANDRSLVFSDANGWLYALIILPLYDAIRTREHLVRLLAGAAGAFAAQTFLVFSILYVMSHKGFGYDIQYSLYRWVRTTGLGEITQMSDHFYRIFLQSHIYAVAALFILCVYLCIAIRSRTIGTPMKLGRVFWIFFVGTLASLALSLSRSFWIAIAVAGVTMIGVFLFTAERLRILSALAWRGITASILALLLIAGIAFIPIPSGENGIGFDALRDRFEDLGSESAAASRWELLPALASAIQTHPFAGYGFGKTVTYQSHDPRVLEVNPSGEYTTYAFEWGYLDFWLKLGVFGLLAIFFLLYQLLTVGWRAAWNIRSTSIREHALLLGVWLAILTLAIVHIFTPYIVHPLGIGILMLAMRCFERLGVIASNMKSAGGGSAFGGQSSSL